MAIQGGEVSYIMSLKDLMSGAISKARSATASFENQLKSTHGVLGELKSTILEFASAYAVFEFGKESMKAFTEESTNMAQIKQVLDNTKGSAGQTMESLEKMAKAQEDLTLYTQSQTMGAEKQLLSFRNVRGEIFNRAIPALEDYAAFMKIDVSEAATTMGRALNNPVNASRMLRLMHIALTPALEATIKHLTETGHVAEAQSLILDQVNKSFKGAAATAANTNPYLRLAQIFEKIKLQVGELIVKGLNKLYPALREVMDYIRDTIEWMKEHAEMLKLIGETALRVFAAYMVLSGARAILTGLKEAQTLLNIAMSANPFILVATAVAVVITNYDKLLKLVDKLQGKEKWVTSSFDYEGTKAILENTILDQQRSTPGTAEEHQKSALEFLNVQADKARENIKAAKAAMTSAGFYSKATYTEQFKNEMANLKLIKDEIDKYSKGVGSSAGGINGAPDLTLNEGTKNIEGTKTTHINITIGDLIKNFTITTQNMAESAGKIKQMVEEALVEAVNDSQIAIGH